ncbi:MAG: GTP pyrophosphokinase, partial [Lentisphaerota bacterium]
PYIMHPFRVMLDVSDRVERVVAILHDVLEDCPSIRPIDLINDGISDAAVVACEMLNKKNFPDYATYIDNIAQFGYPAFNVKLADLRDNMGVRDLKNVDENKTKYQKAYNTLIRSLQ